MEIRNLRYFVHVSESRSFSKAAHALHVGQPALSRSIQLLEQDFGCQLLTRTRHGVELTSAGQALLARSKDLLDQFAQLRNEVRANSYDIAGVVSVGVPSAVGQIIVPEIIAGLGAHYPGIRLHIVEGRSSETYGRLLGRGVDIGLLYDPSAHADLAGEPLATENMVLLGQRAAMAALGPIDDLAQLENLPLILPKSRNSRRLLVEQAFRERSLLLNVIAEVDGFVTTHALLRKGIGFSLMTDAALAGPGSDSSLLAVTLQDPNLQWRLHLVRHRSQLKKQATNVVVAEIKRVVARLVRGGLWQGVTLAASLQAMPAERGKGLSADIRPPS